jgi:hypothetical protein
LNHPFSGSAEQEASVGRQSKISARLVKKAKLSNVVSEQVEKCISSAIVFPCGRRRESGSKIACANVAGLLLSRAVQRQKEMAIRASLGAGLWQVVRQLLAENCALAAAGSAMGIFMAHFLVEYLTKQLARLPIPVPHLQRIALDDRVLLFNVSLYLMLICVVSAAPILMASKADPQAVLRGGTAAGASKFSIRLFSIFIGCEAAFARLSRRSRTDDAGSRKQSAAATAQR